MTTRTPERVIFCGAGNWGKNLIRVFVAHGVAPVGFAVRSDSALQWLAAEYPGVPADTDAERLIAGIDADVVVIATPTETHGRFADVALHHGLDVFVEKPLSTDPAAARALGVAARVQNTALFTGFVYLHHPAFAALRRAVASQSFSEMRFSWTRPALVGSSAWELLPHELALASELLGELPEAVSIEDNGERCRCRWTSSAGTRVDIRLDGRTGTDKRKEVVLRTAAGEVWNWTDHELVHYGCEPHSTALQRTAFGPAEPLRREVEWFLNHRRCAATVRREIDRSVAITTLIHGGLATVAPGRGRSE